MNSRSKKLIILVSLLLVNSLIVAQTLYFPDKNWETKDPTSLGINAAELQSAVDFALENDNRVQRDLRLAILEAYSREPNHSIVGPTRDRGNPAGLIIKDGYIIAGWGDLNRVDMTFSVTKSYLSTIAGLAVDDGLIPDVHDNVKNYVWDGTFDGEHNGKVTWHHLLNQSSDWSGSLFGIHDWADRPPREGTLDDWRNRQLNEPGTVYKYNDVRVNLLAYSLLHVHRKPLPMVLKQRIMDPIGASTTWRWFGYENTDVLIDGIQMQSVSGGGHHGGGLFINTYDQARFGLLFARRGNWNGQQLISEDWVRTAVTPSETNPDYGYMWWLLKENNNWENVPDHVYNAAGFGGNFIIVDEVNDLVVVLRWIDGGVLPEFMSRVYKSLIP
jgi:CubicO group peptidase (beta-lactamase class C family)